MTTEKISYEELARRVGDCVLFNNHNAHNEGWWCTLMETPLVRESLDTQDAETAEYMQRAIDDSKDESEKAKLIEELEQWHEDGEKATVTDSEIYQTYHITSGGAEYLMNHTAELVSYDETLDAWLWHIGHFGTSWSGVYTTFYDYLDEPDHDYIDANDYQKYTIG